MKGAGKPTASGKAENRHRLGGSTNYQVWTTLFLVPPRAMSSIFEMLSQRTGAARK
jgi:hypothetical protein